MKDYLQKDTTKKTLDRRLLRRFLQRLKPHRNTIMLAILLLAVSSLAGLAGPYLIKYGIDRGIIPGVREPLLLAGTLYFIFLGVEFLISAAKMIIIARLSQRFMLDLRVELFQHLQSLPISFFDRNPVGRLMTRISGDVEVLNELFTAGMISIFGDIFILTFIVTIMFYLDAGLALLTLIVLPLLGIVTLIFRTRIRRNFRQVQKRIARINAFLQERLSGMEVIHLFTRERSTEKQFAELNRKHTQSHLNAVMNFSLFFPLVDFVGTLAVALLLYFGGRWLLVSGLSPDSTLSLGTLVAFIQYTRRFYRPLSDLSEKFNILQSSMASAERIFGLLDEIPEPSGSPTAKPAANVRGDLQIDNLQFRYNPDEPVLNGVTFRARPGERVALVGLTGCGKSTILSLLLRFYQPDGGTILLDDQDIQGLDKRALRACFALVQQDVFLFPGTIAENICLGNHEISAEQVESAARAVGAHNFISKLPDRYDTVLKIRGGGLSTGQRQLIAFARALAHDPAVLILDEATSSVDTATEAVIEEGLAHLMKGRTCLIVAHRLSTIQNADRIVVISGGGVAEEGRHRDLLALSGLYARLYRLQFLLQRDALQDSSLLRNNINNNS
jgi:ATP-binding cassette, subfamily B, multidrug efflux pump